MTNFNNVFRTCNSCYFVSNKIKLCGGNCIFWLSDLAPPVVYKTLEPTAAGICSVAVVDLFTTKTSFYFEQNQCCQSLEVELQIFTVSGKLVKNMSQFVYSEGYRSNPIEWDGRDDFGDKIGKGVYVYRLKVKTSDGQSAEKFEKLVILN